MAQMGTAILREKWRGKVAFRGNNRGSEQKNGRAEIMELRGKNSAIQRGLLGGG